MEFNVNFTIKAVETSNFDWLVNQVSMHMVSGLCASTQFEFTENVETVSNGGFLHRVKRWFPQTENTWI